jgi:hypothetical protein
MLRPLRLIGLASAAVAASCQRAGSPTHRRERDWPTVGWRALLSVLALLAASPLPAQTGTITGTVRDAATGVRIDGATVAVAGTALGARTSVEGTFVLLEVPAGTYTLTARRFGYATSEVSGVDVQVGRARTVHFSLYRSATDTTHHTVFEPVLAGAPAGSAPLSLTQAQIGAMPTLSLAGVFGVNGGYVQLPRSAATVSLSEVHRGIYELASMRGARPSATRYLIDGISVNHPVFGAPPLLLEPMAAGGVTVFPSHVDPEYGGALAGVVEQGSRGAADRTAGAAEVLSGGLPGRLGSRVSAASGVYSARGYLAGPVPGGAGRLHYVVAANTRPPQCCRLRRQRPGR